MADFVDTFGVLKFDKHISNPAIDEVKVDDIIFFCCPSISKYSIRPATPLTTYTIIDKASINTIKFLFEWIYQEKKTLAKRAKIAIHSPKLTA